MKDYNSFNLKSFLNHILTMNLDTTDNPSVKIHNINMLLKIKPNFFNNINDMKIKSIQENEQLHMQVDQLNGEIVELKAKCDSTLQMISSLI